jgi:hypothetical protein
MFEFKPLSLEGIPAALARVERYRLLNEPRVAESICLDILNADPDNSEAIPMMILAITDQFRTGSSGDEKRARDLLPQLKDDYERAYYAGIICERLGKATIDKGIPDSKYIAYEWMRDAMEHFEAAEAIRPSGNDDAILRWNTCVRSIERYKLEGNKEVAAPMLLE